MVRRRRQAAGALRRARCSLPTAWPRAAVAALAVALGAAALGSGAGAAHGAPRGLDYVALGDSVASGRGLGDLGGVCRRSPRAYPHRLRELLAERWPSVRLRVLACAGAEAIAPQRRGLRSLRRQVDAALRLLGRRPALVTVTVGVNDTDWSDIVRTYARLREPDQKAFERWARRVAARVGRAVAAQLRRLLARPSVRVVLTDYFNPVNRESLLFGPPQPCPDVEACYLRTELVVDELNAALARVPRELGARRRVALAAVRDAFRGHESPSPECGAAPPGVADTWIQYPSDPASNSFPPLPPIVPGPWRGDCFHPSELGAAAIAAAVDDAARALRR